MSLVVIPAAVTALLGACAALDWFRARQLGRQRLAAIAACRAVNPPGRPGHLQALTSADPANPLAWYLRGCESFRAGDYASAARFFGMAHHLDPDLLSAALLTFTALKSASPDARDDDAWIRELVVTWREMNLPGREFEHADHAAWQLIAEPRSVPDDLSDLGRLAWIVAPAAPRSAIGDVHSTRPAWAAELFRRETELAR